MTKEKYPPNESNIAMTFTPGGVLYQWPSERDIASGSESIGAVFYMIFIIFFMGLVLTTLLRDFPSIENGFDFGNLFLGFMLLMLLWGIFVQVRTLYFVLSRPIPASLQFTPGEIIYKTGTKRLRLKFDGKVCVVSKEETDKRVKNKTYTLPIEEREIFSLENIGDYLLLSFNYRGERIEIGSALKNPDKEWLYNCLKEYK